MGCEKSSLHGLYSCHMNIISVTNLLGTQGRQTAWLKCLRTSLTNNVGYIFNQKLHNYLLVKQTNCTIILPSSLNLCKASFPVGKGSPTFEVSPPSSIWRQPCLHLVNRPQHIQQCTITQIGYAQWILLRNSLGTHFSKMIIWILFF